MVLLYAVGAYINPAFFGTHRRAVLAVLRDAARYGVMAVGMTFVIVNKELDLSVGSTFGLVGDGLRACCSSRPISTRRSRLAVFGALVLGLVDRADQRRAGDAC